jgi:uncharacterized protein (TIGR02453 family)
VSEAYFDDELAGFFAGLRRNNSKEWFDAHRDEWERVVRIPIERLLEEAEKQYGPGKVLRPNRDVRFSRDKSPYRTSAAMVAGLMYLRASDEGLELGGGLYQPTREQLSTARTVIDERPHAAAALEEILDDLEGQGYTITGPSLRTAPKGFARDHPRIALLRLQSFAALRQLPLSASRETIASTWDETQPLIRWIRKWVDGGADSM